MSHRLELFCQSAGSGKTHQCIQTFRQAILKHAPNFEKRAFFILPSREHVNRINDLLLRDIFPAGGPGLPLKGLLNPSVLTINEFLKHLAGITIANTPGDILRKFLIKSVLEENTFEYFESAKKHHGFLELAGDFVAEAKSAYLALDEFEKVIFSAANPPRFASGAAKNAENSLFAKKVRDLARMFKAYDQKLRGFGLEDPEDLLRNFVDSAPEREPFLHLDLVILDGFYHFTFAQRKFLSAISSIAEHVIVTLTMDQRPERSHIFSYPEETRQALLDMGFRSVGRPAAKNRRTSVPALAFLEKNLFASSERSAFESSQNAVQIFEATGVSGEIEMIAREIRRLYREGSCHFSDFCLILRSIGAYEEVVRAVFASFGIPVEIHERKKLKQNAFVRALTQWLRLIRENWRREHLFALLQSNYYGFDPQAVRSIEQRSLEEGVLEGAEAWEILCAKLPVVERKILESLLEEYKKMTPVRHPAAYKTLLLQFIGKYQMTRRLACQDDATRDDFQACRTLETLMDEITLHRGREADGGLLSNDYLDYLLAAIDLSLYSVPIHEKNRVQVYDVILALQKEYKVIFIVGLLEKNFPQRVLEDALLKDEERQGLNHRGTHFEERLARGSGERYFFYMAVTRAKERLYLTYPRFDLEGKEALPSFYIEEVKHCLGEAKIPVRKKEINQVVPFFEEVCAERDLFMILTQGLFEKKESREQPLRLYASLFNNFMNDRDYISVLAEAARDEEKAEIRDPRIFAWFKNHKGPFSATRLETFATCPFKYFSEHVLGLKERPEGIDPMELGRVIHQILQELYEEIASPVKSKWPLIVRKEEVAKRAREKLEEVFQKARFMGAKKLDQDLTRARLWETLEEWMEQEYKKELTRKTVPAYFEKRFGFPEEGSPDYLRLKNDTGEDILIRGVIDRIDIDPETKAAIVIDYKSGAYKADQLMDHLGKGIELQIPIYLLAAGELLGLRPVAGEIYPVMAPAKRKGIYDAAAVAEIAEVSSRSAGLLEGPDFRALLETIKAKIPEYVERLQSGDIAVRSKACGECPYDHLCRFEKWRLIYSEGEKVWEKSAR